MDIDSDLYVVVRNYVRTIAGNDQSPVTEEQLYAEVRKYIIDTYSLSGGSITEAELTLRIRTLVSTLVSEELAAGNISQWVNTTDLFNKIDALIQASVVTPFSIPAITVNNYVTNGTVWDDTKIRDIIEDMLDGKLDNIVDGLDQYGNYVEYAFKNAPTQPMTPVGGSYDGTTFTYPTGWSDDPVSTSNSTDRVWVSYSKWKKVNNVYVSITGWSTPIPVSGSDGSDGTGGQDGIGADGNWHEFIYRISDSTTPSTPVGGYLDSDKNIHPPTGWDDDPIPTTSTKPYLYMSKGVFVKQGSSWVQLGSWTAPVRTTGDSGTDGIAGTPGSPGVDGFDATSVTLLASTQGIGYNTDGTNPSASAITFTTQVANYNPGDILKYTFSLDGTVVQGPNTTSSYTYTVPSNISSFPAPKKFSVKVDSTLYPADISEDYVSVYAAKSGSDALTVILSNENHTIPVSNVNGTLTYNYSGSGTKITVYRGTELIKVGSGNNQFTVSAQGSNITVGNSVNNADGTVTYSDSSNIMATTATITFTITYKNAAGSTVTITRQQSINKTADGANGAKVATGYVYWSNTSSAPSTNPTASSYSFTSDSFTGLSSGWQRTPPTLSQGTTTSAMYYATFSAIETAANSNIATSITFGQYTKGTEFQGLVLFTEAQADAKISTAKSDVTNAIKTGLGSTNYTLINGGNIATGTLTADKIVSSSYLTSGVRFGLGTTTSIKDSLGRAINAGVIGESTNDIVGVLGHSSSGSGVVGGSYSGGAGSFFCAPSGSYSVVTTASYHAQSGVSSTHHRYSSGTTIKEVHTCTVDYSVLATKGKVYSTEGYAPFTGSHVALVDKTEKITQGDILCDLDVVVRGDISNTLMLVTLSTKYTEKNIVGVYVEDIRMEAIDCISEQLDPLNAERNIIPIYRGLVSDNKAISINAVGEGKVNVCGLGGNLEPGDLITSSRIAGKGMKQDDNLVRNYTVAKCREYVEFDYPEQVKMVACIYMCG